MRVFRLRVYSVVIYWFPLGVLGIHVVLLGPWVNVESLLGASGAR
jgi:hypothetical protein